MTRQNKKDDELYFLKAYLDAAGILIGEADIEFAERPDFLLEINGERVGVEVTDYHVGCNRREVEEHWRRLRQWPMLLNDFPRYRSVELQFRALRLPSRRQVHDFVSEVISLIAAAGDDPVSIAVEPTRSPVLSAYVSRVEIAPSKVRYLSWSWNHDVAWVGATEEELMVIIAAKAASTVVAASSYWLMITEGATLSRVLAFINHEWLKTMPLLIRQLEEGPFDRLILLQSPIIEWRRDAGWRTISEKDRTVSGRP